MNNEFVRERRLERPLDDFDILPLLFPDHSRRRSTIPIVRWRDVKCGRSEGRRVRRRRRESRRVSPVGSGIRCRTRRLQRSGRVNELLGGVVVGADGVRVKIGIAFRFVLVSSKRAIADDRTDYEYSGDDDGDERGGGDSLGLGSGSGDAGR